MSHLFTVLVIEHFYTLDSIHIFWMYMLSSYSFIIQLKILKNILHILEDKVWRASEVLSDCTLCSMAQPCKDLNAAVPRTCQSLPQARLRENQNLPSWSKCKYRQNVQKFPLQLSPHRCLHPEYCSLQNLILPDQLNQSGCAAVYNHPATFFIFMQ